MKEGLPPRLYRFLSNPSFWISRNAAMCRACAGLQVGQSLTIRNGDPLLHNVRAEALISQPFDLGTPIQGMEVTPERFRPAR